MDCSHIELPGREKESGNEYWKSKDYTNASKSYSKALLAFNHLIRENLFSNEEQLKQMTFEIQLPCLVNLAACYLNLGYGYSNVVVHCTDALKIQPTNIKALYRRAIAYTHLDQFKEAKADIDSALELDPANASLFKIQSDLNKRQNSYREKTKKIAQKAFAFPASPPKVDPIPHNTPWWRCNFCKRKQKIA